MVNPVALATGLLGGQGEFQPFANVIMPAFLEYQNGRMSRAFFMRGGVAKRTVAAMQNEDFNKEFKNKFNGLRAWEAEQNALDREVFLKSIDEAEELQRRIIEKDIELAKIKIRGKIELYKEIFNMIKSGDLDFDTAKKLFDELTPAEAAVSSQAQYNPVTGTSTTTTTTKPSFTLEDKPKEEKKKDTFTGNPNIESTPYSASNPKVDPLKRVRIQGEFIYTQKSANHVRNITIKMKFLKEANMKDHMINVKNMEKALSRARSANGRAQALGRLAFYRTQFRKIYGFYA